MRATWAGTRTLDARRAPSLSDDHALPKISPVTTTQASSPTCRRPPADRPSSPSRHPSPLSPSPDSIRASISGSAARLFFFYASCISLAHHVACNFSTARSCNKLSILTPLTPTTQRRSPAISHPPLSIPLAASFPQQQSSQGSSLFIKSSSQPHFAVDPESLLWNAPDHKPSTTQRPLQ